MVIFVISKQQHFENVTPNSFQKIRITTTTTTITEKKHFKTTINRPKMQEGGMNGERSRAHTMQIIYKYIFKKKLVKGGRGAIKKYAICSLGFLLHA